MSFDGEKAYGFVESIAFPRLSGSEGWKKCRQIIKDEFKKYGYEVKTQEFKSTFTFQRILQVLMIPIIALFLIIIIGYIFIPWMSLILCILILCGVPFITKIGSTGSSIREPPKNYFLGENIFVHLKSKNSKIKLVLMAHHDSKSQVLPIFLRVVCFIFLFIGAVCICLFGLIFSILKIFFFLTSPILDILIIIFGCIGSVPAILLGFNFVTNISPGALDNGTAVALVMELSRILKNNTFKNVDITFLLTDAEELGLLGAKAFIKEFGGKIYDKNISLFLNFEAPGAIDSEFELVTSFGIPKQKTSKKLNEYIRKAATLMNWELKERYWPFGVMADHNPILNAGYQATLMDCLSIGGGIHTKNDNMTKVSKENLQNAGLLVEKIIEVIDNEFD
ncbi:MAG: M28 family peptidase [Candidatus Lokiarchaeota archaeon]|nr:M28 family peptidase [Candidatus Lokiarchaeota archaeon]